MLNAFNNKGFLHPFAISLVQELSIFFYVNLLVVKFLGWYKWSEVQSHSLLLYIWKKEKENIFLENPLKYIGLFIGIFELYMDGCMKY